MLNEISKEMAEVEFARLCKFARVRLDRPRNKNDKADVEDMKDTLIADLMEGRIVVDDEGKPTVITESEDLPKISFTHRPLGTIFRAMDREKNGQDNAKTIAAVAESVHIAPDRLRALEAADLMTVLTLFSFFLVR